MDGVNNAYEYYNFSSRALENIAKINEKIKETSSKDELTKEDKDKLTKLYFAQLMQSLYLNPYTMR